MAALTPYVRFTDGLAHRTVVFLVVGATTLDTVDVAAYFTKASTADARAGTSGTAIATSIAGTVITLTLVGLSSDAVWLLVTGAAAA